MESKILDFHQMRANLISNKYWIKKTNTKKITNKKIFKEIFFSIFFFLFYYLNKKKLKKDK